MKTQNHTPGPWQAYNAGATIGTIEDCNGINVIADVRYIKNESKYNGQLISAAPDLLSALERLAEDYSSLMRSQGAAIDIGQPGSEYTAGQWVGSRLESPMQKAWKAIAKAKGETL